MAIRLRNIQPLIKKLITMLFLIILTLCYSEPVYAKSDVIVEEFSIMGTPKVVLKDKETIELGVEFEEISSIKSETIYLYELQPFEYEIVSAMNPIDQKIAAKKMRFTFEYKKERLYKKYVLATVVDGKIRMLCKPQYITNPELLAQKSKPRKKRYEFCTQTKGMANIPLNGKGGIYVTANTIQVLNSRKSNVVTHPLARKGVEDSNPVEHYYYMLNAAETAGIESITKELAWYASHTNAQDFIIGNEVNQRVWNYMAFIPWEDYVREYANLFRVCYNAIKSTNKNARVYVSIDGNWNRNREIDHWEYHTYIDSKDFLDLFNQITMGEGNIDWDLTIHPYIVPLDYAKFWDYSEHPEGEYMVRQIETRAMYSFQNMKMVTGYMLGRKMRNPKGEVRDIIINELGVDRTQGNEIQAAAICASYVAFKRNPYITQYMYLDTAGYGADLRLRGKAKKVFKALGTVQEKEYLDWALSYIGVECWEDILDLYPEDYVPMKYFKYK